MAVTKKTTPKKVTPEKKTLNKKPNKSREDYWDESNLVFTIKKSTNKDGKR